MYIYYTLIIYIITYNLFVEHKMQHMQVVSQKE